MLKNYCVKLISYIVFFGIIVATIAVLQFLHKSKRRFI